MRFRVDLVAHRGDRGQQKLDVVPPYKDMLDSQDHNGIVLLFPDRQGHDALLADNSLNQTTDCLLNRTRVGHLGP